MGCITDFASDNSPEFAHTATYNARTFIDLFVSYALCAVALLLSGAFFSLKAATLPQGFTETMIASGLSNPTAMAFAPDGRLFVCLQDGQLRVIKNGVLLATPFLTVSVDSTGERGLLGVAFDPNFTVNGFVYIYYTTGSSPRHNRVSRFTASGDVSVPGSETVVLDLDNLSSATNHNGGAIHFGPDGKLYIAVGENANPSNSQTLTNLLGKVLRINADGTIPSDNPFFNTASGKNRAIWALGLRNPFTFAFQSANGRMFINDVGQSAWEEINDGIAGSNYGWPTTEGPTSDPRFRGPIFSYQHGTGPTTGCAITGGTFYNPSTAQFPGAYVGNYFFADLCSGWIRRLDPASNNAVADFATGISNPVDLKVGPDGSLYYLARGTSAIFRIQYVASIASITATAGTPQSAIIGATFATQLQATVRDSAGNPVSGVSVTFTAPASGASGTFPGNATSATVTTNSSGVAVAPQFTANGTAGSYSVVATLSAVSLSATYTLTNAKANTTTMVTSSANPSQFGQSVTFTAAVSSGAGTPVGTVQFKDGNTNLGTPVALSQGGVATLSISSLAAGTHVITADYSGDNNFSTSTGTLTGVQVVNDQTKRIELSNSSYTIREDATDTPLGFASLAVDVIRTGDISQTATVRYFTSDTSGGNECNQVTGQASQRCDYLLVNSTLRFAAGEATKTINIPVVKDGYLEGSEVFTIGLQNPTGATIGANNQASVTIIDTGVATTPAQNFYLNNNFFVRMNYLDFLGRDADSTGFNDWLNVLNTCGPQQGFLGAPFNCDRAHVVHGFYASPEFTDTGFLMYRMYEVGMGRLPKYAEFIPDMATLSSFGISDAVKEQNLQDYLQQFAAKSEFTNRFAGTLLTTQAADFVLKLEQTTGITLPQTATTNPGQPTQYGRQELINLRANGTLSVGQTLKAFVEQQAVYDKFFPRGAVTMQYFANLRRDPDLNDPNLVGWNDWVDVFTNGRPSAGIAPRDIHHLIFGFIYSEEYRKRFGQP
jgi:glucose/arabinose dehydrogenase